MSEKLIAVGNFSGLSCLLIQNFTQNVCSFGLKTSWRELCTELQYSQKIWDYLKMFLVRVAIQLHSFIQSFWNFWFVIFSTFLFTLGYHWKISLKWSICKTIGDLEVKIQTKVSTLPCVKLYLISIGVVDVRIHISAFYFVTLWHIQHVALYVQLARKTFYWKWLILPSPVLAQVQRGCALIRSVSLVPVGVECSLEITNEKALHVKGVKT